MLKQQILSNLQLDKLLLKDGYVVVSFLNPSTIAQLKSFFSAHHPNGIDGFYATAHAQDIAFRNSMNDEIRRNFEEPISKYFHDCRPLGGSFVVKSKTNTNRLHPHQDWNIVDENKFRSFNIWVPLIDLNQSNGAIRVMPRSHKWIKSFRGPNIPDNFDNVREHIWSKMIPLHMKAGEALIYDHRLFHASDPNQTNELRIAAVFGIIPQNAEMLYYFGKVDKIEVYESSVDFFMNGNIQKGNEQLRLKHIITTLSNRVTVPSLYKMHWFQYLNPFD
jgi:hypothetical protein